MKKVLLVTSVILISLISSSCKKDKGETTAQKIQHNWTLVSVIDNSHDASGDSMDTTAMAGDFMNFNANGTVAFQVDGSPGTSSYSIVNNTLVLATETYTIKVLTDNQFILYAKDTTSATEYDEETITLKR